MTPGRPNRPRPEVHLTDELQTEMSKSAYLKALAIVLALVVAFGATLYLVTGARLFSYYGWPGTIAIGAIALFAVIRRRYRQAGFYSWPAAILLIAVLGVCALQAGFWAYFFNGDQMSVLAGQIRNRLLPYIELAFLPGTLLAAALAALFTLRGFTSRKT